ncbi:hypothetical protein ELH70_14535 [Rhizobium ruizarguesonis]|uniref:hypothetical protein n=1 Tax=Rhizobium ruizarguesonis TaxID=2081791 RepID=UPI0010302C17|nr:hypothetical protein [Rhizobium ruizarguesonis]TAZ73788.1 hypothetical protein ELH70_14535 [Rhizobium ruizarguesonis]TAZ86770.1 hypothetical protein ELH69_37775 [Rhizobium ruizarguesonis]
MEDLLKHLGLLGLSARHHADAKANEGERCYWVKFDPTIRRQYFRIEPRHRIAPSLSEQQEFVISRMNTEGNYVELFSMNFRRTDPKHLIEAVATSRIEKWLDEEEYNHPMEEHARLCGDPFVERRGHIDLMDPARRAAKNARAEAMAISDL